MNMKRFELCTGKLPVRVTQSLSEKGSDPLRYDPLRHGPKTNEIDLPPKGQTPFRIGSQWLLALACSVVVIGVYRWPAFLIPTAAGQDTLQGGIEIADCRVAFRAEIDVPALDSGALREITTGQHQSVAAGQSLAKLEREPLLTRRRIAELRRTVLAERLDDQLEIEYSETAYEEARITNQVDEDLYKRNPGSLPLVSLRRSRLALKRAELDRQRVLKQRREAELELQTQVAEISSIDEALRRTEVMAPMDGIVLSLRRGVGEWVNRGDPVLRMASLERLSVIALVHEDRFHGADPVGMKAVVRWSDGTEDRSLFGIVESIDPQLLEQKQLRLHISIDNQRDDRDRWILVPGRRVTLVIAPDELPARSARSATEEPTRARSQGRR